MKVRRALYSWTFQGMLAQVGTIGTSSLRLRGSPPQPGGPAHVARDPARADRRPRTVSRIPNPGHA